MHDKDGRPLEVGDVVHVPCRIKELGHGADYCNVTLETEERMHPGPNTTTITLNARQVIKAFLPAGAVAAVMLAIIVMPNAVCGDEGVPTVGPLTKIESGTSDHNTSRKVASATADCPRCVRVERRVVPRETVPTVHRKQTRAGFFGGAVKRWLRRVVTP